MVFFLIPICCRPSDSLVDLSYSCQPQATKMPPRRFDINTQAVSHAKTFGFGRHDAIGERTRLCGIVLPEQPVLCYCSFQRNGTVLPECPEKLLRIDSAWWVLASFCAVFGRGIEKSIRANLLLHFSIAIDVSPDLTRPSLMLKI